ncbi:MAG: LacI family DNA-binding transcriptional regulator [Lachnospiraceae bacterium]|nr:LacI family DNA-binding transcriptional regulator [Ruminococcus sp.]MCM1275537.1 LacI family DNA-binding transcriptional regulator [Lachnospiraceae bacterium]
MNITIKDVAKAANVSVATVSRVLNNKNNVSEEAVQAVNRAVEELGYSPNFLGRDLRKSETKRILAIIGSTERNFYSDVLRGMQDAAFVDGYDILIAVTRDDPEHEMHLLGMLFSRAVDGVVLLAPKLDSKIISDLSKRYRIAICLERLDISDILCVTIDNERAGYDATSYLIGKGRRRIGLITTEIRSQSSVDRENGYMRALKDANIPFDPELVYYGDYDADTGTRGCEELLRLPNRPDAIFSISDTISIGAMTYAVQHGITIGKDLLFFGFDNIAYSHMFIPRLSTVEQPCYLQGKTVVEKLIANMKTDEPDKSTYMLPHSLILRESTGD